MIPRPPGARKLSSSVSPNQDSAPTPVTHGYVKASDGTELFYSVEGQGKPLVFCYGLVCSSLHWTYQIEHFKNLNRAIWHDYRGHQNSGVPKDLATLTLESMALDIAAILDELHIHEAVFLGHSMGVNVVLEFCKKFPERVVGMVLANGTSRRPLETIFRHNVFEKAFSLGKALFEKAPYFFSLLLKSQKSNPIAKAFVSLSGFNPHLTPQADIELYIRQVSEMNPAVLIQLVKEYENYDSTSWLQTITCPTLIIAGEEDKITPLEQQELIHQLIPGSQLEVILHGSHCSQMDFPDLINEKIQGFLDQINYGSRSSPSKEIANQSIEK